MAGNRQLGERIKAAGAGKGWKQKHLAAEVDVEPITVSRWERGATTPGLEVLRVVAEATRRPLSFFVEQAPVAETPAELPQRVERLEQSLARVEQKLDALLERLAH
ncbi:MAG: helix-turn-helix domain-containing protein [Gaiellaceae bacterium]